MRTASPSRLPGAEPSLTTGKILAGAVIVLLASLVIAVRTERADEDNQRSAAKLTPMAEAQRRDPRLLGLRSTFGGPLPDDLRRSHAEPVPPVGTDSYGVEVERNRRYDESLENVPMVLIPAGTFRMGLNEKVAWVDDFRPQRSVFVGAYWLDRYEVTNERYARFLAATGHAPPKFWNDTRFNAPTQPVVGVTWQDADEFCRWAGKRLPTEAEWEKAARGGLENKKYPWGDDDPRGRACFQLKYDRGQPMPIGSYAPNGYGLHDMAGNVEEWCSDWYQKDYYQIAPSRDPSGPSHGEFRVARGGGWDNPLDNGMCVGLRGSGVAWGSWHSWGFRCARSAE